MTRTRRRVPGLPGKLYAQRDGWADPSVILHYADGRLVWDPSRRYITGASSSRKPGTWLQSKATVDAWEAHQPNARELRRVRLAYHLNRRCRRRP